MIQLAQGLDRYLTQWGLDSGFGGSLVRDIVPW